jgi:electron transport complex protein RnfA
MALLAFAALRERLETADVPEAFRGAPLALVTAGLMALAFMGFGGLGSR